MIDEIPEKLLEEKYPRELQAYKLRQQGMTYKKIAETLGHKGDPSKPLSHERARQLVKRWERVKADKRFDRQSHNLEFAFPGLDKRNQHILFAEGFRSAKEVMVYIDSGGDFSSWANVGRRSEKRLNAWLSNMKSLKGGDLGH